MRIWLFIPLIFISIISQGQSSDGIKPGTDTAAIDHLLKFADTRSTPDSCIELFKKALQISIDANYADGAFTVLITTGIKYAQKEDYASFRNYSKQALKWASKSNKKDAVAWCYNNIGTSYFCEGNYTKAADNYYTAVEELKKNTIAPTHTGINIYNNLGMVNIRLGTPVKALAFFDIATDMAQKGRFDYQLANSYTARGEYYLDIRHTDSAIKYFSLANDIGKKISKSDIQAENEQFLSQAFIQSGEYKKAIVYAQEAIIIAEKRFYEIAADAYYDLGDAWYRTGQYKQAESILLSTLKEIRVHNFKDKYMPCYTTLADVYKATGQYKKAIACMDTLAALKDSLTGIEKTKAISQLELKYKTAEQDKQIVQNQLVIARQSSNIIRKNIWIGAVSAGIALLGLLLLVIYRNARHRQRLQAEQIKTLQKESTIGNLKSMVQGEENERARIARELHDGIGGALSAAMMRLMAIRHDKEDVTNVPAYNEALALLDDMGAEIRKTAHNLMPETLLKQTLPEAVASYCHSMQKDGVLHIDFQSLGDFGLLGEDVKLNVYRMIQELLRNIVQHAQANTALVQLMMHGHALTITVEDNGKGFDKSTMKPGMGMQNLQTRVGSLNGHYALETALGRGTSVFIEIDLTAPQP